MATGECNPESDIPFGIPDELFKPDTNRPHEGVRRLIINIGTRSLHIRDADSISKRPSVTTGYRGRPPRIPRYGISANATLPEFDPVTYRARRTFSFNVRTRPLDDTEREPHPCLYASRLLMQSLRYFDSQQFDGNTYPITHLDDVWHREIPSLGRNAKEYYEALADIPNPTFDHQKEAAFAAWTGIQASANGFTDIESITEKRWAVKVLFARPEGFCPPGAPSV